MFRQYRNSEEDLELDQRTFVSQDLACCGPGIVRCAACGYVGVLAVQNTPPSRYRLALGLLAGCYASACQSVIELILEHIWQVARFPGAFGGVGSKETSPCILFRKCISWLPMQIWCITCSCPALLEYGNLIVVLARRRLCANVFNKAGTMK